MLKEKATYRIIALLALIVLLSVAAIIIEKNPPDFLQESHQEDQVINQQDSASAALEKIDSIHLESINKPEKKMFAGGLDPKMLKELEKAEAINKQSKINKSEPLPVMNEGKLSDKNKADSVKKKSSAVEVKKAVVSVDEPAPEAKAAIQSIINLRYGKHKEYMRVVFDGPHDIISEGKVRHKDNEVSVTFADSGFLLKKEKVPIPVRRAKNKVIFQKNNLEKIRVHNLSNPSRLAIDFYTKREDSEQPKTAMVAENGTVAFRTEALETVLKHDVKTSSESLEVKNSQPDIKTKAQEAAVAEKETIAFRTEAMETALKQDIKTSSESLEAKKSQPAIKIIEQEPVVAEKETVSFRTDALETELKDDVRTVKASPSVEEKAPVAVVENAIHEENVQTLTEVNVTSAEKEKALADVTINDNDSLTESRTGSDRKVNQVIKVEAPVALAMPSAPEVAVPSVKPVIISPVKTVQAEKSQPVANKKDQRTVDQMNVNPVKEAPPELQEEVSVAAVENAIHEENVQALTEVHVTSAEKEKALADATINDNDSLAESKSGPDRKVNQVIKVEAPVALAIPSAPEVAVPSVKPVIISPAKTVQAEKSQPVAKKKDQGTVDQKNVNPVKEAPPALQEEVSVAAVENAIHEENVQALTEVHVTSAEKEKALADATINDNDSLAESKSGPDRKVNQVIKVEAPVALAMPSAPEVAVPSVKPVIISPAKTVQAEKSQPVEQSNVQKALVQEKTLPVKKASPAVELREPVAVAIKPASEAEVKKAVKYEAKPAKTEKSQPVVPEMAGAEGSALKIKVHKERIALLPFDNFSGTYEAPDKIMPLIVNQLENRGYDVIDSEEVEAYLCEKRIRYSSSVSREVAAELGRDKMVNTAIAGSVLTFSSDGNPKIGILARQLNLKTGHIIWSDFVSLTGEDYTKVLGLGTINSIDMLIPDALNNLFAAFGNHSQEKDSKAKYRIAVLPFKNESKHRHAGIIITHLFQNELANNQMFDTVDYGEIKKTIVNLRVGKKGEVDYNNLQALAKLLGVDVVLTGTVEKYQTGREYQSPPIVTISARLLDSRKNRILWYDNLQLDGEENIIALDWGRLRSADKVAYGAVSGLVENIKTEGLVRLVRLRSADNVAYGAVSGLEDNIKTEGLLR